MPSLPNARFSLADQSSFLQGVVQFPAFKAGRSPGSSADLKNIDISSGAARRRLGFGVLQSLVSSSPVLLSAYDLGHGPRLAALSNTSSGGSLALLDARGPGLLFTTPRVSHRASVVTFLGRLFLLDPGFAPLVYVLGSSELVHDPDPTGLPQVSSLIFFQGRGWAGGDPGNPDLLYFSTVPGNVFRDETSGAEKSGEALEQIVDWDLGQAFRLSTGSVRRLISLRNNALLALTTGGIETVIPDACSILASPRRILSDRFGTVSPHSVIVSGEDIIFMDQSGEIRSLKTAATDEAAGVLDKPLSVTIPETIDRLNRSALDTVRAALFRGRIFFALPLDGAPLPNEIWAFSPRDRSWAGPFRFGESAEKPRQIAGLASIVLPGRPENLFLLSDDAGTDILRLRRGTDGGLPVAMSLQTQLFGAAGSVGLAPKTFQAMEITARPETGLDETSSLDLEGRTDGGAWVSLGSMSVPLTGPTLPQNLPFVLDERQTTIETISLAPIQRGRGIEIRVSEDGSGGNPEITRISVTASPDPVRFDTM